MKVELAEALPIAVSTATTIAMLGFGKALENQAEEHYGDAQVPKAKPHMIRNFVVWWTDLTVLVVAGLSTLATAALVERTSERLALASVSAVYWFSAVLAAVSFSPFVYQRRFRFIRWCAYAYNRSWLVAQRGWKRVPHWRPRTSPAFPLVLTGNGVALAQTIQL